MSIPRSSRVPRRLAAFRRPLAFTAAAVATVLATLACGDPSRVAAPADVDAARTSGASGTTATVYVVHGINGRDLGLAEALPVDVEVNGACAIEGLTFRRIVGPLSLPAGAYDVAVHLDAAEPCGGPVAASASGVQLAAGENVSVVAHLTSAGQPTLTGFANDLSRANGRTRLVARHAADFGPVDLLLDGARAATGLANGGQVQADARPGRTTLALTPSGTSTVVWSLDAVLRPFKVVVAYAVGTPANGTFEVLTQTLEMRK